MTQKEKVMQYMEKHGSITQREAILYLHCYRLGARIWDLANKDNVPIQREMLRVKNGDGTFTHIARYSILKEE